MDRTSFRPKFASSSTPFLNYEPAPVGNPFPLSRSSLSLSTATPAKYTEKRGDDAQQQKYLLSISPHPQCEAPAPTPVPAPAPTRKSDTRSALRTLNALLPEPAEPKKEEEARGVQARLAKVEALAEARLSKIQRLELLVTSLRGDLHDQAHAQELELVRVSEGRTDEQNTVREQEERLLQQQESLRDLSEEVHQLRSRNGELIEMLRSRDAKIAGLQDRLGAVETRAKTGEEESEKRLKAKDRVIEEFEKQVEDLSEKRRQLHAALEAARDQLGDIKRDADKVPSLQGKERDLYKRVEEQTDVIRQLKEMCKMVEAENKQTTATLSETQSKLDAALLEIEEYKTEADALQRDYAAYQEQNARVMQDQQSEIAAIQESRIISLRECEEQKIEIKRLVDELNNANHYRKQAEADFAEAKQALEDAPFRAEESAAEVARLTDELRKETQRRTHDVEKLREDHLRALEKERDERRTEVDGDRQEHRHALDRMQHEAHAQVKALRDELDRAKTHAEDKLAAAMEEHKQQITAMQWDLTRHNEKHATELRAARDQQDAAVRVVHEEAKQDARAVKAEHEKDLDRLRSQQEEQLLRVRDEHAKEIEKNSHAAHAQRADRDRQMQEIKAERDNHIQTLRDEHQQQLRHQADEHNREIFGIKENASKELHALRGQMVELQSEHVRSLLAAREEHLTQVGNLHLEHRGTKDGHHETAQSLQEQHYDKLMSVKEQHAREIDKLRQDFDKKMVEVKGAHEEWREKQLETMHAIRDEKAELNAKLIVANSLLEASKSDVKRAHEEVARERAEADRVVEDSRHQLQQRDLASEELRTRLMGCEQEVRSLTSRLAAEREKCGALEAQLQDEGDGSVNVSRRTVDHEEITGLERKLAATKARVTELQEANEVLESRLRHFNAEMDAMRQSLLQKVAASDRALEEERTRISMAREETQRLKLAEEESAKARKTLDDERVVFRRFKEGADEELGRLRKELETHQSITAVLRQRQGVLSEDKENIQDQMSELGRRAVKLETVNSDLASHVERLEVKLAEAREAVRYGKSTETELRRRVAQLEGELRALRSANARYRSETARELQDIHVQLDDEAQMLTGLTARIDRHYSPPALSRSARSFR